MWGQDMISILLLEHILCFVLFGLFLYSFFSFYCDLLMLMFETKTERKKEIA